MDNKIPLPTDNIYKFYALFGLLLLVTSIASFIYLHQTTNALLFETEIIVEELNDKKDISLNEARRQSFLQHRIDIAKKDRDFYNNGLAVLLVISAVAMIYGFSQWHYVVQPKQDKLLDFQIQKAEQELKPRPKSHFRVQKR